MNIQEIANRLPVIESLTPQSTGKLLFSAFGELDKTPIIRQQLSFCIQHKVANYTTDGYPAYTLHGNNEYMMRWLNKEYISGEHPVETSRQRAQAPHIIPRSLNLAPTILTATIVHHTWGDGVGNTSILIAEEKPGAIHPFFYDKVTSPAVPQPIFDLGPIQSLLRYQPSDDSTPGVLMQAWKLTGIGSADGATYALQANLALKGISLNTFLRVMSATPEQLNNIES